MKTLTWIFALISFAIASSAGAVADPVPSTGFYKKLDNGTYLLNLLPGAADFMIYEHWASDETHNLHLASPGFVNYSHSVAPMIQAGYPVRKRMVEISSELRARARPFFGQRSRCDQVGSSQ